MFRLVSLVIAALGASAASIGIFLRRRHSGPGTAPVWIYSTDDLQREIYQ